MANAYVSGLGMYMPENIVTNQDLIDRYGIDTDNEWIVKRTGIEARRFAPEGICASDMGAIAAKRAIENAGLQNHDIDMILFATLSPEMAFPGCGVVIQAMLGFAEGPNPKLVPAMDIRNQCSGFIYGLATARAYIHSGMAKHVLLVGAEVHSAGLELSTRGRAVASLFGDGAGAAVISATDEDRGIRGAWLGSDGRFAEVLCQKVWNMRKRPFLQIDAEGWGRTPPEDMWAHMEGKIVFKHAVEKMIACLMQGCWDQKITTNDIDLFVFHQANLRINQYIQTTLGLPDSKVVHNIQKYGNTTAATIPTLLCEAVEEGKLKPGMKVACVAFGSGFTWGCTIIDW